jgi:cytochrome c-type biogenesis protein CcmH/NrfG
MPNNGNLQNLAERLRAKTDQEAQEIENLTRQQFERLSKKLNESSKNALDTTANAIVGSLSSLETEIASHCRIMSKAFGQTCLKTILLMFCAILTLTLFSWGILSIFRREAQSLREETAALAAQRAALEQSIAILKSNAWGLTLQESKEGRFIIPHPPLTLNGNWKVGEYKAWRLE